MKYHAGILDGAAKWSSVDALILAHTPGIPFEWIYAALGLGEIRRRRLRETVQKTLGTDWTAQGVDNAASVEPGDGWKMLEAVCPGYSGPAPLWAQIDLQKDTRSDAAGCAGREPLQGPTVAVERRVRPADRCPPGAEPRAFDRHNLNCSAREGWKTAAQAFVHPVRPVHGT